jgi:hypothetical protein
LEKKIGWKGFQKIHKNQAAILDGIKRTICTQSKTEETMLIQG